jgi:hypothetical protein
VAQAIWIAECSQRQVARQGAAILGGRLTGELMPDRFDQETILQYAMNEVEVA